MSIRATSPNDSVRAERQEWVDPRAVALDVFVKRVSRGDVFGGRADWVDGSIFQESLQHSCSHQSNNHRITFARITKRCDIDLTSLGEGNETGRAGKVDEVGGESQNVEREGKARREQ
jgi:hypothetical protein